MEDRKQYRDELLEWCNSFSSYWNSVKPHVSDCLDTDRVEEWEGACRQLREKLQEDETVEFEDYLTAKSLYEQWEQQFKGMDAPQEVMDVDSEHRLVVEAQPKSHDVLLDLDGTQEDLEVVYDHRMEIGEQTEIYGELWESDVTQEELAVGSEHRLVVEEQPQIQDELMATNASQEIVGMEKSKGMELDEQLYYREDLLERCNHIYSNWENMKPSFSKLFESLVEWEVSYRHFKEKLEADIKADFDDYQRAKSLLDNGNGMLLGKK